ncbi:conserved hypothetical protein [Vibrio chagasii]|nr:conserved hypothetical protein [Vibrio chagasii]CAH7412173.1 conserved hypothetical protein [Vibrio chagasii]CAH7429901.1 conserved hypothetical protein [Vibrio chagasii]
MTKIIVGKSYKGSDISHLVDSFYLESDKTYKIIELDPVCLDLTKRLDIFIKLNAIDSIKSKKLDNLPSSLYSQHIIAMTDGRCEENGNTNKNSLESFFDYFSDIIESMGKVGFSAEQSLIPINSDFEPLNGAHRIAAALYYNEKITCVVCGEKKVDYGFNFFSKLGFDRYHLYQCIFLMQKHQTSILTGIVWPSANIDVNQYLEDVILVEELKLNDVGVNNFVINTYLHEEWLGTPENNFIGSVGKSNPCTGLHSLKVFLFKINKNTNVVELKESIRNDFGLGKHSIHICDGVHDSAPLSNFSLNPNITTILNIIKKYEYPSFINDVVNISKVSQNQNLHFVLSGSSLLGLLGIREPKDIDYLSSKPIGISEMDFHGTSNGIKDYVEIKNDPYSYFVYFGINFYSIEDFIDFKKKRNEPKDIQDIELLIEFVGYKRNYFSKLLHMSLLNYTLLKMVVVNKIKKLLHKLNMFCFFQKIYRYFKS